MLSRDNYQEKRLRYLTSIVSLDDRFGLEIGACNKPTVPHGAGFCKYADFRTADEMSNIWGLDRNTVCNVDYLLKRYLSVSEQITELFDYVIACHVIEHVPDPIGYIRDLGKMLHSGGHIFLTVPDMRHTFDVSRPTTKIDHLLANFYNKSRYPTLEHIIEFHRYALEYEGRGQISIREAYDYAVSDFESGEADAHCHVWHDSLFDGQFKQLAHFGFLGDLEYTAFEPTPAGFNEFTAVFTRRA